MKIVANKLFEGYYIRVSRNKYGTEILKVYDAEVRPDCYIPWKKAKPLFRLLKMDKRTGKFSLNLHLVRRQHGGTWIKKRYREIKTNESEQAKLEAERQILQSHDLPA